ncbi:MAG: hypothetical protein FJ405_09930 [Verrucomicrobia bacterium]|nr:hypothetical protein [Verrucomicrobiota bacterium]
MRKAGLVLITVFWLGMMGALVRSEFTSRHSDGIPIPAHLIWERILQASDPSVLVLTLAGSNKRMGSFKWVPTIIEQQPAPQDNRDIEGMVAGITGYSLDLDGNALLQTDFWTNHIRISGRLNIDTNQAWTDFFLQLSVRPDVWVLEASAKEATLRVRSGTPGDPFERTLQLKDLTSPSKVLRELTGGALPEALLNLPAFPSSMGTNSSKIEARRDHRLRIGSHKIRSLLLRATILGHQELRLYINPQSGEVLRLDLPNQISLVNEILL